MPYEVGAIHLVRASNRFRITLDTNRYSVPSEYASTRLTLKAYPEHLVVYHQDKLIARHVRSYDRHQDFENPDHPRELRFFRQIRTWWSRRNLKTGGDKRLE